MVSEEESILLDVNTPGSRHVKHRMDKLWSSRICHINDQKSLFKKRQICMISANEYIQNPFIHI